MKMANLGIERAWELRTLFLFVWGNGPCMTMIAPSWQNGFESQNPE
jgi:hypothetical protein